MAPLRRPTDPGTARGRAARGEIVRKAIAAWERESGQSRIDIEGQLKGEVREGKGPQVWPGAE